MKKRYIVCEILEDDFMQINDLEGKFNIIKMFSDLESARNFFLNELRFQCDSIKNKDIGEIEVINIVSLKEEDYWEAIVENNTGKVYYNGELQYTLEIKEMEEE